MPESLTQCGRARRILWPDASPREATPEVVEAQTHLARCAACRAFFEEMRELAALVRSSVPRPPAPADVRRRVLGRLRQARGGSDRQTWVGRRRRLLAVAAAVVLGLGSAWWSWRSRVGDREAIHAFAEDHVRAATTDGLASSEPEAVRAWLEQRLPFAIQVPALPRTRLVGGRLCLMDGELGAVLEFELEGHAVSYYVVPGKAGARGGGARTLRSGSHAGYRVVAWQDAGLVHALVGDLPQATLAELARRCIEQSRLGLGAQSNTGLPGGHPARPG